MPNLGSIDWSSLPAIAVMGLVVIVISVVTWKQAQVNAAMLANALEMGAEATQEAVRALTTTQSQSREFYVTRLDETKDKIKALELRVGYLEGEIKRRDERIQILESENERLHKEIDALRARFNNTKEGKKTVKDKKK